MLTTTFGQLMIIGEHLTGSVGNSLPQTLKRTVIFNISEIFTDSIAAKKTTLIKRWFTVV